jgi:polyisoprenyl-phosphate glycosyltransferase
MSQLGQRADWACELRVSKLGEKPTHWQYQGLDRRQADYVNSLNAQFDSARTVYVWHDFDGTITWMAAMWGNQAPGVANLGRRTRAAAEAAGVPFEIILVDDGSRDQTWALIAAAAAADKRIRGLRLRRNHGHQLALTAGLHAALGDRVLAIDADLQDPPELLTPMLALMEAEDADVVYGQHRRRPGEGVFKRFTAWAFYRIIDHLSDTPIPRDTGDFRLMRREVVDVLRAMPEHNRFIRGMVAWIGGRQIPYLYDRDARFAGETKYSLRGMIRFAGDALTGFSRQPLALATHAGVLAGLFSLALGVFSVVGWTMGLSVPGWTSLMSAIGFLSAVQLLFLGVLGQYVGRLYEQEQGRPLYLLGMSAGAKACSALRRRHCPAARRSPHERRAAVQR